MLASSQAIAARIVVGADAAFGHVDRLAGLARGEADHDAERLRIVFISRRGQLRALAAAAMSPFESTRNRV